MENNNKKDNEIIELLTKNIHNFYEDDKELILKTINNIIRRNNVEKSSEEIIVPPIHTGDKTTIEITITDEDKAFSYFGRALNNRLDTTKDGFIIESIFFSKDKYRNSLKTDLLKEIINVSDKTMNKFRKEIYNMMGDDI